MKNEYLSCQSASYTNFVHQTLVKWLTFTAETQKVSPAVACSCFFFCL